ncbi:MULTISPECIES: MFS transporter [unclassified Saccharibacter]|uniref:MFS transporter n=1 Tax=unclassified Saccharibacter TaxID=2648722 RepID=UPI0013288015|nr:MULTISPECIES: MFS transporter [unclassified Saccharibacter]MXV35113.1 MFS transporter [Saccharibacter sp. EH611]MXV57340.1 MFS transporter [Saccharibacter sp. EH70]MXV64799.1 MFS transporter [Saccharibacter sp. EH60]
MASQARSIMGLAGVLCTALLTTLNEQVSTQGLPDIMGGIGMSHDPATWFTSLYSAAQVVGAGLSPWMALTFSLRRWAFIVLGLGVVSSVLIPFTDTLSLLYILRTLQGIAGGFAIPLMMFSTLRILSLDIRTYGLASYALTATCFPYLSTALAGLWTDFVDWRFVFWQVIPLGALAWALLVYGMPVTEPDHGRFRMFNWRGVVLFSGAAWCLSMMLLLGDWLDWFNSPFICVLGLVGTVCVPLLVWNEWNHVLPFFKFQLLGRRNYLYGVTAISLFVLVSLASSTVPGRYLTQIAGYRPEQSYLITLEVAAVQLIMLPIVGYLLNQRYIDSRVVGFVGMTCVFIGLCGDTFLTSVWLRNEFYLWQFVQAIGGEMILASLLLMSTNAVVPAESAFAVALVNMPRSLMQVVGTWLIQLVHRWRGTLHSQRLTDHLGVERYQLFQGSSPTIQSPTPLTPDGRPRFAGSMALIKQQFHHQTQVLELTDLFFVLLGLLVILMLCVLILPVRTYPPWIVFARSRKSPS